MKSFKLPILFITRFSCSSVTYLPVKVQKELSTPTPAASSTQAAVKIAAE